MTERTRRRSGGRAGNKRKSSGAITQMPWRIPRNIDRPIEPLTPDGVEAIHNAAMEILEDIGIDFLNEEALALFKEAGCKVEGEKVFFDRGWIMEMIGHAPSEFTITPRNPDRQLPIGGNAILFGNVSSPPQLLGFRDWEKGSRQSRTMQKFDEADAVF